MKIGKKMLCALLAVVLIWPFSVTDAFAAKSGSRLKKEERVTNNSKLRKEERTTFDEKVDVLVDNGYSRGEVALLSEEDVGASIDITSAWDTTTQKHTMIGY